jgi:hypothetical protein
LVLTAVLSVTVPGTSAQSVFSVFLSLFYIKAYGYYGPYLNREDDILAETGQFQIYMTFFVALIIQNALLPAFWFPALGLVLVFLNLSVVYYSLYVELQNATPAEEAKVQPEEEEEEEAPSSAAAATANHPSSVMRQRKLKSEKSEKRGWGQNNKVADTYVSDWDGDVEMQHCPDGAGS